MKKVEYSENVEEPKLNDENISPVHYRSKDGIEMFFSN
jgi:hypothetical protein